MDGKTKPASGITGNVRELIDGYIASDPEFREALKHEAVKAMAAGDLATGRAILLDYIGRDDT